MMEEADILTALEPVIEAFESMHIPYYLCGSIASSAYGMARATMDVDIVSDLKVQNVRSLVSMLEQDFYIDENMITEAINRSSSFNIIHLETMLKVDIFIPNKAPYSLEVFKRRQKDTLGERNRTIETYIATPEDVILGKLMWFRIGGEVSEQQWKDIFGVLKVQGNHLDMEYLMRWAQRMDIAGLLEKAIKEAE